MRAAHPFLLLAFTLSAYGGESERNKLEVIEDPAALAEARKREAERAEEEISALLESIEDAEIIWHVDTARRHRGRVEKELKAVYENPKCSIRARVNACLLLFRLGGPPWLDAACQLAQQDDADAAALVLDEMKWLWIAKGEAGPSSHVKAFLIAQADSKDSKVVASALLVATELGVSEVEARVRAAGRLKSIYPSAAAAASASFHPTTQTLDSIERRLLEQDPQKEGLHHLTAFLKACRPEDKPRAMELLEACLVKRIEARKESARSYWSSDLCDEIKEFGEHAGAEHLPLLRVWIADKRIDVGARGRLLAKTVKLAPLDEARGLILRSLDTDLVQFAILAMADVLRDSKDHEAIQALQRISRPNFLYKYDVAVAASAIGGASAPELIKAIVPRLTLDELQRLQVALGRITRNQVIESIQKHGLLEGVPETELKMLKETPGDWTVQGLAVSAFSAAKRLTYFDVETGELPVRHDHLIQHFAQGSAGVFKPEAAWEQMHQKDEDDFDGPYTIEFIWKERLYRVQAQNFGDWYDVGAVTKALNRALKDSGRRERFVGLLTGDQCAAYVFADPEIMNRLCNEVMLPVATDPDSARRIGKVLEERVLKSFE